MHNAWRCNTVLHFYYINWPTVLNLNTTGYDWIFKLSWLWATVYVADYYYKIIWTHLLRRLVSTDWVPSEFLTKLPIHFSPLTFVLHTLPIHPPSTDNVIRARISKISPYKANYKCDAPFCKLVSEMVSCHGISDLPHACYDELNQFNLLH
jgi:hypothetical protein